RSIKALRTRARSFGRNFIEPPAHRSYDQVSPACLIAIASLELAKKGQNMQIIKRFLSDDSGATAIEYALIAAGIALAIITAVNTRCTTLINKFDSINSSLK